MRKLPLLMLIAVTGLTTTYNLQAKEEKTVNDAWKASKDAFSDAWEHTKKGTTKALEAAKDKTDELFEDGVEATDGWADSLKKNAEKGWDKTKEKVKEWKDDLENDDKSKEKTIPEAGSPAPVKDDIPEWQKA